MTIGSIIFDPEISRVSVILSSRQQPLWKGDSWLIVGRDLESSVKSQWNLNIGSRDIAGQRFRRFLAFFTPTWYSKKNFCHSQKNFMGPKNHILKKNMGLEFFWRIEILWPLRKIPTLWHRLCRIVVVRGQKVWFFPTWLTTVQIFHSVIPFNSSYEELPEMQKCQIQLESYGIKLYLNWYPRLQKI